MHDRLSSKIMLILFNILHIEIYLCVYTNILEEYKENLVRKWNITTLSAMELKLNNFQLIEELVK